MFNKADLLARLQDGDTVEDIAQEMTDALNAAKDMYNQEQDRIAKEEAAAELDRRERERVLEAKREAVKELLDGMCDYYVAAGDDEMLEIVHKVSVDEIVELLDSLLELKATLDGLKVLEFPKNKDMKDFFNFLR